MIHEYTRENIIADNPIEEVVERYGVKLKRVGAEWKGLCPIHNEKTPSFTVHPEKRVFKCFGCNAGGSVIDFVAKVENISIADAMKKLTPENKRSGNHSNPTTKKAPPVNAVIEKTYDYVDATGKLIYQAVRYKPKDFRQRRPDGNGGWIPDLKGVQRVLYRLPMVIKAKHVWLVEGEKDADTLNSLGFPATTNVCGSQSWLDGYSEFLVGKEVYICGDNDKAGEEWLQKVIKSLEGKVKTLRIIRVPEPHKDITDHVEAMPQEWDAERRAGEIYQKLVESTIVLPKGVNIPIYTMEELEEKYRKEVKESHLSMLKLGRWLPTLGCHVRGLLPGELVTVLADTGVGKTMILQNILTHARPLRSVFFELELPETLTFERFVAHACNKSAAEVFKTYEADGPIDWASTKKLNHIAVCPLSGISPDRIEELVVKSELKTGEKAKIVGVDYLQLVKAKGKNRYERLAEAAEQLKVVAKNTGTIVVMASQVARDKDSDSPEVYLHDAKGAGEIENSSGLVIGAWKEDKTTMKIRILKNTKGQAGALITCDCNGETMTITERHDSKIDESDSNWN